MSLFTKELSLWVCPLVQGRKPTIFDALRKGYKPTGIAPSLKGTPFRCGGYSDLASPVAIERDDDSRYFSQVPGASQNGTCLLVIPKVVGQVMRYGLRTRTLKTERVSPLELTDPASERYLQTWPQPLTAKGPTIWPSRLTHRIFDA